METLAQHHLKTLRQLQPQGPYYLTGHSFGTAVAFELAWLLEQCGETVALLAVLDGAAPQFFNSGDGVSPLSDMDALWNIVEILQQLAELDTPTVSLQQLKALGNLNYGCRRIMQWLKRQGTHEILFSSEGGAEELRRLVKVYQANLSASDSYRPLGKKLCCAIHLYYAEDSIRDLEAPKADTWGWAQLTEGGTTAIPVEGNHLSMMKSPHVNALAQHLMHPAAPQKQPPIRSTTITIRQPAPSYSVMTIQSRKSWSTPLFCIPGAGGSVATLTELATALGSSRPVYGLQPRGLDGEQPPHASVEEAAEHYLEAIRQHSPQGPLHLLGHSFGGWIAFAMARQLASEGHSLASLTLIDSEVPSNGTNKWHDDVDILMELIDIYEQTIGKPLGLTRADLQGLDENARLPRLHRQLVKAAVLPQRSTPEILRGTVDTFAAALRCDYRPDGAYTGPVRLALARDEKLEPAADRKRNEQVAAGWKNWTPQLAHWHSDGNHMTLLRPPHVNALADWLDLV